MEVDNSHSWRKSESESRKELWIRKEFRKKEERGR